MDNKELARWIFIMAIAALLSTCKLIDIDYTDKRGQEISDGGN